MKIYISGYSPDDVELLHYRLEKSFLYDVKINIISDWYFDDKKFSSRHSAEWQERQNYYKTKFQSRVDKIKEADLFILKTNMPDTDYESGCYIEAGLAYTERIPFILYGYYANNMLLGMKYNDSDESPSMFQVKTLELLVDHIKNLSYKS